MGIHILIIVDTTQNIGYPSIMTPSKKGKTKIQIFYSLAQCINVFVSNLSILSHFENGRDVIGRLNMRASASTIPFVVKA